MLILDASADGVSLKTVPVTSRRSANLNILHDSENGIPAVQRFKLFLHNPYQNPDENVALSAK
jgi:hypothetical protein